METDQLSRKLAVILHADVVDSTALVRKDESLAHQRFQDTFRRFSETIGNYGGIAHEIRGDALVAEFSRPSDALCAALAFQTDNTARNETLTDDIRPALRVGISLGEVVIADSTVTGAGVVLAQRLEQLAATGGVVAQASVVQTAPGRMPFEYEDLGPQSLKGFEQTVWASQVRLVANESVPQPEVGVSQAAGAEATQLPANPALELPEDPSIAVLPFENMSGDAEQEFFSDGIAEDIITALSKADRLFVVARNSSFTYRDAAMDIRQVGRELGVRYCLKGSVRKAGNRARVTAQLIDTTDGNHLWAERYDRSLEDVFAVQDEITEAVSMAVGRRIVLSEVDRVARERRASSGAREMVLRTQWFMDRLNPENFEKAKAIALEAIEKHPDDAGAHSILAFIHIVDAFDIYGGGSAAEAAMAAAAAAKRAIALDPNNETARANLVYVLTMGGDLEGAIAEAKAAYNLNTMNAASLAALGAVYTCLGAEHYESAKDCLERAIRVSPQDPMLPWWYLMRGLAEFFNRDFETAITWMTRALERNAYLPAPYRVQAACWGQLGDTERAKVAWEKGLQAQPGFDLQLYLSMVEKMFAESDLLIQGFRRAGIDLPP